MTDTIEPISFVSGETVAWTKSLDDYLPADSWVLTYVFVKDGEQQTVVAADNGDGDHLATISAADSGNFVAGIYQWQAHVDDGTDHHMVDSGRVEVKANFLDKESGFDARSHAEKTLDAIEAVIENRATQDQQSYTIQGTTLTRMPIVDLIKFRGIYRNELKQQKIAENLNNGLGSSRTIKVRL